ncbi:MAG: guanylate kinase [Kiritimatiellia bacterium]|jgi:guanylate kinase
MIEKPDFPLLFLISAASGTGKTTLCKRLLAEFPALQYSISCTTRSPRPGEVDGEHYQFLEEAEFERLVEADAFLEHARVFDHAYGTLRVAVEESMASGRDVIMDVDVQGAQLIRETIVQLTADHPLRRGFVDVFIAPPSIDVLRQRLFAREQDAPEVIAKRLLEAAHEIGQWNAYAYVLINDDLERAYRVFSSIYISEKSRTRRK